ncbi:MAG: hypothetical protein IT374_16255 [Polyangiaceae bacterium]|nr:hypothetical protein [Polyangiaceae bacterium]
MRRRAAAQALVAAALVTGAARADDPPPKLAQKTATFAWDKALLRVTVAYRDVVDDEIEAKLKSGIPTVIVLRAYLFEEGATNPLALAAKSCRVVFDPWDEVFRVQLTQPGSDSTVISPTLEGVLRRCAEAQKLPVVDRAKLKVGGRYVLSGLVEVNPVSKEIVERIKKWVSRPTGASTIAAGDALFGSFVGLFAARIGAADRVLAFKTQPLVVTPPPPP